MHKKVLRKKLLQARLSLTDAEWKSRSQALVEHILLWLNSQNFDKYILYRSFRREPNINSLSGLLPRNAVFYPRLNGKGMDFFSSAGIFISNRFGLEEPEADPQRLLRDFDSKTLLVIPALAYDRRGYRLGYGAGFFDRFLSQNPLPTLGVCFDAFLHEELPIETHDQPVQTVLTESLIVTL